ncbi:DUF2784 domain-containing protein [Aliidiomarina minuta]|uniref:DUF2784 domain-containing protein n=1 Tax=Aliidiomarina minuta TaxID=880057 RepID=A0A432W7I5_9GAMM|nr:DUF2784 domain-containing protein [Aliidiomarina minuta]RUO26037.1 DUF2784 domain-containing protein [Aliidiomarina minuta]
MSNPWYERVPAPGLLADIVMLAHAAVVLFVLIAVVLVCIGWAKNWEWIRNFWFRATHLCIIAVIVIQALRGRYCPLTYWEMDLRSAAGQAGYDRSFIDYWVSQFLYYDLPGWIFTLIYLSFAALVLLTWWKVPPRWPGKFGSDRK